MIAEALKHLIKVPLPQQGALNRFSAGALLHGGLNSKSDVSELLFQMAQPEVGASEPGRATTSAIVGRLSPQPWTLAGGAPACEARACAFAVFLEVAWPQGSAQKAPWRLMQSEADCELLSFC